MCASSIPIRRSVSRHRGCGVLFALFAALAPGVHARTLTLHVDRLQNPEASASAVAVTVQETATGGMLDLQAQELAIPSLELAGRVEWHCALAPAADGARRCSGPVRLIAKDGSAQEAELGVNVAPQRIDLDLNHQESRVRITLALGDAAPKRIELSHVPVAWLRAPLARAWPNGQLQSGTLDGAADLQADGAVEGRYGVADLGFSSNDGALSGTNVDATGTFRIADASTNPHVETAATLTRGGLHFGDVRIDLPQTPVEFQLDATSQGDGTWSIRNLAWRDAGTLEFNATCLFAPSAPNPLRDLAVHIDRATFPLAMQRYASGPIATNHWNKWNVKGGLDGEFAFAGTDLDRIALTFSSLDASDGERFNLRGLQGALDWSARGDRPATTIGWKSIQVDGRTIAALKAQVRTHAGVFELARPLSVAMFGGTLALKKASFDPRTSERLTVGAEFALRNIGYDSADGSIAAAGVGIDANMQLAGSLAEPKVQWRGTFHGGELLYGPFYVKLPVTAVESSLDANRAGADWQVTKFDWNDPGVLEVGGTADLTPTGTRPFSAIDVALRRIALAPAVDRYARSWLAAKGYPDLAASGAASGRLKFDRDGLEDFAIDTKDVNLNDGAGRFAFTGIDGGVDWRDGEDGPPTTLRWTSMELFRIPLGGANAELRSQQAAITLAKPIAVDVLGGQIRLEKLSLLPRSPRGERYAGSFSIAAIDMAQLSAAFGWPRFGGNLSGGIPEIELSGDRIELHGGLDLYVFDGYLGVSGVTLERPFGVAPSFRADIHFENFDLEQLTSAFSFGGMSGRLNGNISELRLVDWSPVAFDSSLHADKGGRMSYKAVNDLTALGGGGGLSSSLQTMALKVFDTFGYRRLGIRCTLAAEVCTMGGVEDIAAGGAAGSGGDSYTIVEGSGLPRIQIIGHRRHVKWPVLVERLVEATRGQGPVIQ
jgi:hypothetical protein